MLTLTRSNGESLRIITENNKVIQITVTGIKGDPVKIAFNAPEPNRVIREELISFSAL